MFHVEGWAERYGSPEDAQAAYEEFVANNNKLEVLQDGHPDTVRISLVNLTDLVLNRLSVLVR